MKNNPRVNAFIDEVIEDGILQLSDGTIKSLKERNVAVMQDVIEDIIDDDILEIDDGDLKAFNGFLGRSDGVCCNCHSNQALSDGRCENCFASDGSENQ